MDRLKKERNPYNLFLGLTGLIVLAAYVNIFPPDGLPALLGLLILTFGSLWVLTYHVLMHKRHATLIAGGIILWLVLRYFGLRHPLYAVLLTMSVVAVEYLWKDRA